MTKISNVVNGIFTEHQHVSVSVTLLDSAHILCVFRIVNTDVCL